MKNVSPIRPDGKDEDYQPTRGYFERDGGLWFKGDNEIHLSNFTARITEEVVLDDGQATTMTLTIKGAVQEKERVEISVTHDQFRKMNWPMENWGTQCMIWPGSMIRDRLRHFIQKRSHECGFSVLRRTVYAHTGWRELSTGWVYLSAGACIGPHGAIKDIEVDIGELGRLYQLPDPSNNKIRSQKAAMASLQTMQIASSEICITLISMIFLAPLSEALAVDFTAWVEGPSRSMKSSVVGVMAAHFGKGISRTSLTANWEDTSGSIGLNLFTLADTIAVIDDYAPQPSTTEQARVDKTVHTVVRGVGNRSGRGRLSREIRQRKVPVPRGLVLATAEHWPPGESINARLFGIPMQPGDVNTDVLTEAQENAREGLLSLSMSNHLRSFASDYDGHIKRAKKRFHAHQKKARGRGLKGRLPDQAAFLLTGFDEFITHLVNADVLKKEQASKERKDAAMIIYGMAERHDTLVQRAQPAELFMDALRDILASGGAHLVEKYDTEWVESEPYGWKDDYPRGEQIGWVDEASEKIYLLSAPTIKVVDDLLKRVGTPLNLRPTPLLRQLRDRGFIEPGYTEHRGDRKINRTTQKVRVEKASTRDVIVMPLSKIKVESPAGD